MLAGVVLIVSPFTLIGTLTLVGITAIVLGVIEVLHALRTRIEAGRPASGTAAERRPHCRSRLHPSINRGAYSGAPLVRRAMSHLSRAAEGQPYGREGVR
ncbi:DUF308 domain-containing protein [Streptomyces sp. NPDC049915]|uniref:DUF308 domain-containing protein n=1 Tax=Streptomyces sp. NPDC049915 TaxID=3155510 RepID=UPI003414FF3F